MEEIKVVRTESPKQKPDMENLPFGKYFSDHMFVMNYEKGKGWLNPRIVPYGPFEMDPSSMVFHYAQEIFEGLKAYRTKTGEIRLFRPHDNFMRMNSSAERLCIPTVDVDFCVEALKKLVEIDQDWVPTAEGTSLYIRPFIFATDRFVGVHGQPIHIFSASFSALPGATMQKGSTP